MSWRPALVYILAALGCLKVGDLIDGVLVRWQMRQRERAREAKDADEREAGGS